jgi:hypothetical protein
MAVIVLIKAALAAVPSPSKISQEVAAITMTGAASSSL